MARAVCSIEQWLLRKLINFASRIFAYCLHGFSCLTQFTLFRRHSGRTLPWKEYVHSRLWMQWWIWTCLPVDGPNLSEFPDIFVIRILESLNWNMKNSLNFLVLSWWSNWLYWPTFVCESSMIKSRHRRFLIGLANRGTTSYFKPSSLSNFTISLCIL